MQILKKLRIQDHIKLHDRGDDRKSTNNGLALYSNSDELRAVDTNGNVGVPLRRTRRTPVDVTALSNAQQGDEAYNDGTVGTEGPAFYNGTDWVSVVDGTTIA